MAVAKTLDGMNLVDVIVKERHATLLRVAEELAEDSQDYADKAATVSIHDNAFNRGAAWALRKAADEYQKRGDGRL